MDAPPVIGAPEATPPGVARWRSGLMLLLLLAGPPALGLLGARQTGTSADAAVLPGTVGGLLNVSVVNLVIFVLFALAIAALGRPTGTELLTRGRWNWKTWGLGAGYSVLLRIGLAVLATLAVVGMSVALTLRHRNLDSLSQLRPEIEHVLDPAALRNPLYLLITITLVSFVVAGLREELWRSAVFVGLFRFRPGARNSWRGQAFASLLAAVGFGLGHLPQGWSGVVLTGALGFGLGLIMLHHRSLWIAVLAHGFFDATSFLLLCGADQMGWLDQFLGKPPVPSP